MTRTTRPADITDAPGIAAVIEGVGLFTEDEATGFIDTLPDMLADEDHIWHVALGPGIAGAAYMSLDGMSEDVWNLWFIGVLPDRHRQGTGTALLNAMETHARTARGRLLIVETSGADGFDAIRAFYMVNNYREVARIPSYYAPGDDKVIFCKTL